MYYTTRSSYGTTGVKTITCGFQPVAMRITVGAKSGLATTTNQKCVGTADGARQNYVSTFSDSSFNQTKDSNDKMIRHYENVAGVLTEVVTGTFDSFTATQGKFNLSLANSNYSLTIELWD